MTSWCARQRQKFWRNRWLWRFAYDLNVYFDKQDPPHTRLAIEVVSPPRDATALMRQPSLAWASQLCGLNDSEIEQDYIFASGNDASVRPKDAELVLKYKQFYEDYWNQWSIWSGSLHGVHAYLYIEIYQQNLSLVLVWGTRLIAFQVLKKRSGWLMCISFVAIKKCW